MTDIANTDESPKDTQVNNKSTLSYNGSISSLYGVWLKNLILNILTLFIYRAWAKTRMRKYLWANIKINDHALTYTGTGKELFKGFMKVALFYFLMSLLVLAITFAMVFKFGFGDIKINPDATQQNIEQALKLCGHESALDVPEEQYKTCLLKYGLAKSYNASMMDLFSTIATWSIILYILFYAQYSALRYRLSRTTWCGIRGGLTGSARNYAFMCMGRLIINILTLGIAIPTSDLIKQRAITRNMYLGNKKAAFEFNKGKLGSTNIKTLLLAIPTLGFSRLWYHAELRNQKLANISFGDIHFEGTYTGFGYLKLVFGNIVLLIFTLGLGLPFIIRRIMRFNINNIHILGNINELSISQAEKSRDSGNMGEGFEEARELQQIDGNLIWLLMQYKMTGGSTHYIWRSQDDSKVRPSHAANDDKIFAWNNRPDTGHPGEDYNCRCWAEPLNVKEYANQLLISDVKDSPKKWTDEDLLKHYRNKGDDVTLSEIGFLSDVIEHYSTTLGVYDRVNQQIIDKALSNGEGNFTYDFNDTYEFGGILFSFGESTVSGIFIGDARRESNFMVINGFITYDFFDQFTDPFIFVEIIDLIPSFSREDAEELVGGAADLVGEVFDITDRWQNKFNATVKIEE